MMLHRLLYTTSFLVGLTFPFQIQASDRVAWPKDICEHVCHEETCISSDHIYNLCKTHCIGHFTTKCSAAKRTKSIEPQEITSGSIVGSKLEEPEKSSPLGTTTESPLTESEGLGVHSSPSLEEMSETKPLTEPEGLGVHSEESLLTQKKETPSVLTSTGTSQIDLETKHQINEIYQKTIEIHALVVRLAQQYIDKAKKSSGIQHQEEKVALEHKIAPSTQPTTSSKKPKKHHHHSSWAKDMGKAAGSALLRGLEDYGGF